MKKIGLLSILIPFLLLCSCQKENTSVCDLNSQSLKDHLDFHCGVVVDPFNLNSNPPYAEIVNQQFNSVTAENIMKPAYLHPTPDQYYWTAADELVDYCQANDKRLHGHTLIWHQQLPPWMRTYEGTASDWEHLLEDHITQIVSHFKGQVVSWDVVNEAFNDDGTLRNNIWKKNIGPTYIEKAFIYAKNADPNAILFYNDYSVVLNPVKRTAILNFLNTLKVKGVPIDGIGIQMHVYNAFPENAEISKAIDDIWKNDYLVHISELDVSINPLSQEMNTAPELELERQAEKYLHIFKTYDKIPGPYKFGITIWGVSDRDTWIRYYFDRDDYPLLFDDNYLPKPAYCKLITNL